MALSKVAQHAEFLKTKYKDNEAQRLLLHFESLNLDAKAKALELYQENISLRHDIKELESSHSKVMVCCLRRNDTFVGLS